jgi:membrane protein
MDSSKSAKQPGEGELAAATEPCIQRPPDGAQDLLGPEGISCSGPAQPGRNWTQGGEKGDDWRAQIGEPDDGRLRDIARSLELGRGREATTPEQIPPLGWKDILWRVLWSIPQDRILSTAGSVAFFALLAVFPGIAAIVSLYGLFADNSTISEHLNILAGILPLGVLQLVRDQIIFVAKQGTHTLGTASIVGLVIAIASANSGIAALFDALNVVYDEREKRSIIRFYTRTLLFTLAGIVLANLAIVGVIVLPLVLKFLGVAAQTEWLVEILRWPILLATVVICLGLLYRFGPSRRDARWRWVTWGSVIAALLWIAASMLFSLYVTTFDSYNRLYGSLGAVVGFMIWLWISAVVVLLGGKLNAEMEHQTSCDTTHGGPRPLGSRGAMMADHVGKAQG